jgi:geranylgeranylglycerol-phosphate geranylgeranyltransferase
MANVTVSASDVLICRMAPAERSFRNRIIGLIALPGLGTDIAVLPAVIGLAALSGASYTDPRLLLLIVVVYLAGCVTNITNDIVDAERDKEKWPLRPLATGLLSRSEAVLYMAILSAIGIAIAIVFFNWLFLALGLLVLVLNYVYSRYLRDNIGYVTLILPLALVPVGVWSAFSPETVLTPLPWLLALFLITYQLAAEITHEGLDPNIPALFVRPRPTTERALYVALVIAVFFIGVAIYLYAQLSWLFVVALAVLTVALLTQARNLGDNRTREKLETSFKVALMGTAIYWLLIAVFVWVK